MFGSGAPGWWDLGKSYDSSVTIAVAGVDGAGVAGVVGFELSVAPSKFK